MNLQRPHSTRILAVAAGGLFLAAAACGSRVSVPRLDPEEVPMIESGANYPHGIYRLEPGDRIQIRYTFHSELDQAEIIRPDGKIRASDVGEIAVAGYTTSELSQMLVDRTSHRLRDPEVVVSVLEFAPKSVYVAGEVGKPGPIAYRKGLTPLQAITEAGGFLGTALIDKIVLVRRLGPEGEAVSRALDVERVIEGGEQELIHLAPHDVIFVPRTAIAEANVWVDQHFTQLFPFVRGASGKVDLEGRNR